MNIIKAGSFISLFAIVVTLTGGIKIGALFLDLNDNIVKKNEIMELAKAGVTDVQDDFRNSKYEIKEEYSRDNTGKYLSGINTQASENERMMLMGKYLQSITGNTAYLKLKKDIIYDRILKDLYRTKAANAERIYYYSYNNIYHNSYYCSRLPVDKKDIAIYPSMESCALSGAFPCTDCILGYEKERTWKTH